MITSGAVPVCPPDRGVPAGAQSRIITSAHRINQGSIPDLGKPDGDRTSILCRQNDSETAVPRLIELVKTRIPRVASTPFADIQVLCTMNRGGVGARSLNIELPAALNPAGERKSNASAGPSHRRQGHADREPITTRKVYNGDHRLHRRRDPEADRAYGQPLTAVPLLTALVNSTRWCLPMRRRFTKAKARSTPPSSSR